MTIVEQPGADVLAMRIALADLVPTSVTRSFAGTLVPDGLVAEAGQQTGVEGAFRVKIRT